MLEPRVSLLGDIEDLLDEEDEGREQEASGMPRQQRAQLEGGVASRARQEDDGC